MNDIVATPADVTGPAHLYVTFIPPSSTAALDDDDDDKLMTSSTFNYTSKEQSRNNKRNIDKLLTGSLFNREARSDGVTLIIINNLSNLVFSLLTSFTLIISTLYT